MTEEHEVIAYVFSCGHEGLEVKRRKNCVFCPECDARLAGKKYRCQECGVVFYGRKSGRQPYCSDCSVIIRQQRISTWNEQNGKNPKLKRGVDTKPIEDVHDRVDCVHRRMCLSTRITEDPDVCLTCDEYVSEFDNDERYLHTTGTCSTSTRY